MSATEMRVIALYILLTKGKYMDFTCDAKLTHEQAIDILAIANASYDIDIRKLINNVKQVI